MPSYDSHPDITSFSCVSVRDLRNAIVTLGAFKISTHSIYICQLFNNTEFPQNCHYMGYHYRYHPSSDQSITDLCTGSTAGSENITIISNPSLQHTHKADNFFPLQLILYTGLFQECRWPLVDYLSAMTIINSAVPLLGGGEPNIRVHCVSPYLEYKIPPLR